MGRDDGARDRAGGYAAGRRTPGLYVAEVRAGPPAIGAVSTTSVALVGTGGIGTVRVSSVEGIPDGVTGALADAARDFFANGGRGAWLVGLPAFTAPTVADAIGLLDPEVALVGLIGDPAPGADVVAAAAAAIGSRGAMLLAECPGEDADAAATAAARLRAAVGAAGADVALYWPRLDHPDGSAHSPVGAVAGAVVANDISRGVARAPAGIRLSTGTPLAAASGADRGRLSEAGVNVIARFPERGTLIWGARTLSDDLHWRYVPVRRLFLFLETSLRRGLQWTAFEPNSPDLWTRVRRTVEGFLDGQWRSGALQGATPREAYFVRCGLDTMTQLDIANGVVACEVGFAPVRPAEFVIIRIGLRAQPPE